MSPAKTKKDKKESTVPLAPLYQIIVAPVITEKATTGSQHNQVTFRVHKDATKPVIRTAVEKLFNVKVTAVNTHNRQGKMKVFRGRRGFRSDTKYAIVTLAEGSKIDVTTGL